MKTINVDPNLFTGFGTPTKKARDLMDKNRETKIPLEVLKKIVSDDGSYLDLSDLAKGTTRTPKTNDDFAVGYSMEWERFFAESKLPGNFWSYDDNNLTSDDLVFINKGYDFDTYNGRRETIDELYYNIRNYYKEVGREPRTIIFDYHTYREFEEIIQSLEPLKFLHPNPRELYTDHPFYKGKFAGIDIIVADLRELDHHDVKYILAYDDWQFLVVNKIAKERKRYNEW